MTDSSSREFDSSRREFLAGRSVRKELERRGEALADELAAGSRRPPGTSDTVRLATQAMNCEFSIILNPSPERRPLITASDALDLVHEVETSLTVYRPTSELLELNQQATQGPTAVRPELFALLQSALQIAQQTAGAFNPCARGLNQLWRECRQQGRLPTAEELGQALQASQFELAELAAERLEIRLPPGMGFDLGGMGKGYALDVMSAFMQQDEIASYVLQGGHSSILAQGQHHGLTGWPVGIRHPQFPQKRLATLMLQDTCFSASGSAVQYFRVAGKRYGHLFDPRTGWPVDHLLSVAVTAPTAAAADALSTAFSVMTVEQTTAYCAQHPEIGAILLPSPAPGKKLEPRVLNIPEDHLFWEPTGSVNRRELPAE